MSKVSNIAGMIVTEDTRFPTSRKIASLSKEAETRHAHHVGEVIHAWNCAHAALFQLFLRIAASSDYELALGLWHTVQSDKLQRKMLEATVQSKLKKRKSYQRSILWAISRMDQLSIYRNDAIHAEMFYHYDRLKPGISNNKNAAERIDARPLSGHWRQLKGDLHGISNYLQIIDFSLWNDMPRPLCRRPRLLIAKSPKRPPRNKKRRGNGQRKA